jgi:hypothetical protein
MTSPSFCGCPAPGDGHAVLVPSWGDVGSSTNPHRVCGATLRLYEHGRVDIASKLIAPGLLPSAHGGVPSEASFDLLRAACLGVGHDAPHPASTTRVHDTRSCICSK